MWKTKPVGCNHEPKKKTKIIEYDPYGWFTLKCITRRFASFSFLCLES